jgi:hypothetical protein
MGYPSNGTYNPPRINRYVPNMKCDANVGPEGLQRIFFGALSNASATAVSSAIAMVNGSAVTQNYGAAQGIVGGVTAPFGRALSLVASSTNTRAVTIIGVDYLGQYIYETLTLTSGTAVTTKKAYWKVNQIVFASASDTTTVNVGTANRFGVPYATIKGQAEVVDGVQSPFYEGPIHLPYFINATDLSAGTSQYIISPARGYVTRNTTTVQVAIVTGGDITATIGGTAIVGLTNTIADSATVGTVVTDTPTDLYGTTGLVAANGAIAILSAAAFNGGGAVNGVLEVTPAGLIPRTNTQTATSYDPRGLFEPSTTPDSTKIFELLAMVDVNNTNGFMGSTHFTNL